MHSIQHVPMAAGARPELSKTIRALRERLIGDLRDAAEAHLRLSIPMAKAELPEERKVQRLRLEAWLDEQLRALPEKKRKETERERFLGEAVREAAYTWLNRLVLLRHMEAMGLSRPAVLSGGWNSKGFQEFREFAPGLLGDPSEGYGYLLGLVFDELALDLPGLFGEVGLGELFPLPPATLRHLVDELNKPALESVWRDDTVLGWVYQYWNDPERERLDKKIADRKKIEPHEIASKTQMFTDRYMVEWLLQNSLGAMWLAMCKKDGWRPDAEDVLDALDQRRAEWREKRDRGEVELDALMPVASGLEDRWKYYVPQPIPDDAVAKAPESVRELKVLDPACGSGHFLVIAFDLLAALYEEEARHRGESWTREEIAASILEKNLHGVDIDPRAVQIAAAALHVKAQIHAPGVRPRQVNLVAPALRLSALPENDPALVQLLREVKAATGIPEELTRRIVKGLEGADHLGTLLKVDAEIDAAIASYEGELKRRERVQGDLLTGFAEKGRKIDRAEAKASLLDKLDDFLARHAGEDDLGLRLDGEQLAAGIRFLRMVREGSYDLVVANPPYQGTSKMQEAKYIAKKYPRGKADLYAAFLERGLQLVREGGVSAMLTMRNWMFIKQFAALREHLLENYDLRLLGDVDRGAFEEVPNEVLAATMSIFRRSPPAADASVAIQPTPLSDKSYDRGRTARKRAALLAQVSRHKLGMSNLHKIPSMPVVYWWDGSLLREYLTANKIGNLCTGGQGLITGDNTRFLRRPWEISARSASLAILDPKTAEWAPYIKGAEGQSRFEPLNDLVRWKYGGLEIHSLERNGKQASRPQNESLYFRRGIAFSMIGADFAARAHLYRSVFGDKGSSLFPEDQPGFLASLNRSKSKHLMSSLNPTISFQLGDVQRLPYLPVEQSDEIYKTVLTMFARHEASRETSIEFCRPTGSCWDQARNWAQIAVDRGIGQQLPPADFTPTPSSSEAIVSFAIGCAIGRFDAIKGGWLIESSENALPSGILYLSAESAPHCDDSLGHEAANGIFKAWTEASSALTNDSNLRRWLQREFFKYHRREYENRPIYLPLSSMRCNFVALISIHQWSGETLPALLAEKLLPEKVRLEGRLKDSALRRNTAKDFGVDEAERLHANLQRLHAELTDFIDKVRMCAEQGPPPTDAKCKPREVDAPFEMDLDDGVMINAAALWPLLEPQWKDPKKWWKELANADGKKDYDWSHLAARYFPNRVDGKCRKDPSLAVAHKCFWRYHPARAYAWELRLQEEIGPDFRIDEPDADEHRTRFLADHAEEAREIEAKEEKRRQRKAAKEEEPQQALDFDENDETDEDESDVA